VIGGGLEEAFSRKRYSFVRDGGTTFAFLDPYLAHCTKAGSDAEGVERLCPSLSPPIKEVSAQVGAVQYPKTDVWRHR